MSNGSVLVYNLGGTELLHRVSLKHAMTMLWKGKARVLEADGEIAGFERPTALELVRYVVAKWKYDRSGEVPFSKLGVFRRDGFRCGYCLKHLTRAEATCDHILPKWKGNAASWTNSVTSCQPCNNRKGGRSPKEAGMKLHFTPRVPSFQEAYDWTHREIASER